MTCLLAVLWATGCIELPKAEPRPIVAMAVVLDLSDSTPSERRCAELSARVRQALATPGVKRLDVLALGTGEPRTALEPIVLVPWSRWEPGGHLYEQPGRAEAARNAWIASTREACERASRSTMASPIFAAVKRAAESIKARCTELEHRSERCERRLLFLHSDMRENGEPMIRDRLVTDSRCPKKKSDVRPLPRIDVNGLELAVCGVANTRLGAGEVYVDPSVLASVWTQVLGPTMPAFDASCPIDSARRELDGGTR